MVYPMYILYSKKIYYWLIYKYEIFVEHSQIFLNRIKTNSLQNKSTCMIHKISINLYIYS